MIQFNAISVGERLLPLSFECPKGSITHILGPNGSGKSTLLNAIAAVHDGKERCHGEVVIDGVDILKLSLSEQAETRAYLSQSARPVFSVDVFQYLLLSLPSGCDISNSVVANEVKRLTQLVQVDDKLHRSIHQLSGGEWQRVRLVGVCLQVSPVLNQNAKLLILDEPAAPLDIAQEGLLYELIDDIAKQGITVIVANHDLSRTLRHADNAILLKNGVLQVKGSVTEVITQENISEVFNAKVKLTYLEGLPHIVVL